MIDFLNKFAVCFHAITGDELCGAGRGVTDLLTRHGLSAWFVDRVRRWRSKPRCTERPLAAAAADLQIVARSMRPPQVSAFVLGMTTFAFAALAGGLTYAVLVASLVEPPDASGRKVPCGAPTRDPHCSAMAASAARPLLPLTGRGFERCMGQLVAGSFAGMAALLALVILSFCSSAINTVVDASYTCLALDLDAGAPHQPPLRYTTSHRSQDPSIRAAAGPKHPCRRRTQASVPPQDPSIRAAAHVPCSALCSSSDAIISIVKPDFIYAIGTPAEGSAAAAANLPVGVPVAPMPPAALPLDNPVGAAQAPPATPRVVPVD